MQVLKNCALLFVLLMLIPLRSLAQGCQEGNNPALLNNRNYGFRFDAPIPQDGPNQTVRMRLTSVIGGAVYDGRGNVTVVLNGYRTLEPGKIQVIEKSAEGIKAGGTYCVYPNGWGTLSFSDGKNEIWHWVFLVVNNGQELETMFVSFEKRQYAVTFSQKQIATSHTN